MQQNARKARDGHGQTLTILQLIMIWQKQAEDTLTFVLLSCVTID